MKETSKKTAKRAQKPTAPPKKEQRNVDVDGTFRLPKRFAALNKLVLRDLNGRYTTPSFNRYTKDNITTYLENPYQYAKQLRDAVTYIYSASSHFRRLIQYFAGLSDLAYVVSPYKIDPTSANMKTTNRNYRKTLNTLSSMSIKTQFPKILTVCLREDTFYGTLHVTNDSITIQQLPSDYCDISTIEGNVFNVSFDFSYFSSNSSYLELYPAEFSTKFKLYEKDRVNMRWQELDSPTSFAIKCNNDIPDYPVPPFVGVLRDIYDIEDYRQLRMTKTELENYALLVMKLGISENGEWQLDFNKSKEFWSNLDNVLPEQIGSVLSPMEITKIGFERTSPSTTNTIADAEQSMFTAAGVSSLLFNNEKASSNALLLSIKADQAITFGIVKSIEDAVNRYIQSQSYGKNFKVTFLDCSPFNRKEMGDQYIKACQLGIPMVSYYCASQGLGQEELDSMSFLENDVLGIKDKFIPLKSSSTQSASDPNSEASAGEEGGAPTKDIGEVSDKREEEIDEE